MRQIAARLGGRAELLDVRLMGCQAEARELAVADTPLSVSLEVEPSAMAEGSGRGLIVTVRFDTSVTREEPAAGGADADGDADSAPDETGDEPPVVATLSCTYAALYDFGENGELGEDELDAFARTTGVFALYPYARAWTQDSTARMGMPPLTLQVYRVPLEHGDVDG